MICTTVKEGQDCPFMTKKGCTYNGGSCHPIASPNSYPPQPVTLPQMSFSFCESVALITVANSTVRVGPIRKPLLNWRSS